MKLLSYEKYIDHHKKGSWRVKIKIGGKYVQKFFGFKKFGNQENALKAAIEYRNEVLKKHDLSHRLSQENKFQTHSLRSKKPMIIGVRFIHNKYNKIGGTTYWIAEYSENGKKYKRHFSIQKYGFQEAFLMACKVRYEHCGKLSIYNKDKLPCEPDVPYILRNED